VRFYSKAIRGPKKEGKCAIESDRRQVNFLDGVGEADHGGVKRLIMPTFGFKFMKTSFTLIKGFNVRYALEKIQAKAYGIRDKCV